jgi:hypothetical protein
MKPSEIYRRKKVQYGDSCLSVGRVYEGGKVSKQKTKHQ